MNPASDYNANILGFFDRQLAHDGSTDTSPTALLLMFGMKDKALQMLALAHPQFPFNVRFLYELKTCPEDFQISDMACVTDRAEDYIKFLLENNLTVEDITSIPKSWLVALLEKQ